MILLEEYIFIKTFLIKLAPSLTVEYSASAVNVIVFLNDTEMNKIVTTGV